ncbi:HAMP domain-containing protein [Candidatus Microgenomates bacterium]|nr:HAMP domain-containing protein [Candidatus Microgenomates bacterium]
MNTRSVRFRLTLWYSLAFFVTATVAFAIFYFVTGQILYQQTDSTLSSHGNKILEIIGRNDAAGMHTMLEKQAFLRDFSEIPGMVVILMDNAGRVINSSMTVTPENTVLPQLFQETQKSDKVVYANEVVAGSGMRFWASAVRDSKGALSGVVLVAHPIDVIKNSLDSLLLVLLVVLLVSIFPAVLGGYFLASRALTPVSDMSAKLKRISSENLDERVVNPATGDELEELAETFNSLFDRLSLAFKRERQFIGDVAHELKTPLSTLQSSVEVTLSKPRSNRQYQRGFSEALVDVNRISSTLKNILDLAWSDADNAVMAGEKFNLSDEVAELRDMATKMAFAKKILVKGTIARNVFILGKRDKLGRALLNIIDNAAKYTPEKGTIVLNLQKKRGLAQVTIKDTGQGIAKKDLPHIFERFYRGGKTVKTFGSGLGLAIAKAAITAHQGVIKVESDLGHGTTFTVTLPLARSS